MSTIAVFAALGGGAYAAVKLPKNSVGAAQIKANAVSGGKVKDGSLSAKDFGGTLPAGAQGLKGDTGAPGAKGDTGAPGAAGTAGKNGTNGTNGTDGVNGADGADGTARAYGFITNDNTGTLTRSKGVVAVTHVDNSGEYCIQLDPAIVSTTVYPVATIDYQASATVASSANTNDTAVAQFRSTNTDCAAVSNSVEIKTFKHDFTTGTYMGNVPEDEAFFFIVP